MKEERTYSMSEVITLQRMFISDLSVKLIKEKDLDKKKEYREDLKVLTMTLSALTNISAKV